MILAGFSGLSSQIILKEIEINLEHLQKNWRSSWDQLGISQRNNTEFGLGKKTLISNENLYKDAGSTQKYRQTCGIRWKIPQKSRDPIKDTANTAKNHYWYSTKKSFEVKCGFLKFIVLSSLKLCFSFGIGICVFQVSMLFRIAYESSIRHPNSITSICNCDKWFIFNNKNNMKWKVGQRCGHHYPNRFFSTPLDRIKNTSLIHGRYPSFITLHVMPTPFGNLQPW